jgi:tetratricopeptide (TPR) repeat protein
MQAAYTEFFKAALYKKISFLSRDQSASLITHPVEGLLEYDPQAVDRIYDITSGHPYFTQLICHELFSTCQQNGELSIREKDVEAVLEDVVERGTVNLKFVWDEASDIEKWGLASLAHLEGKADTPALADFLRKQRVRFSESDLTSGLLHLREKDILTKENRFVIYLLKLWLKKNRPIDQVREELTEVNPIANRYNEIGLEFKDARVYDKAIESFQEALAVAKDNLQAQVNIALTYMDQKMYDKVVVEFEKALTMDDEDVAARAGLCEAHLALGDVAMTRGRAKEATLSYQRVLAINAEHTEARGRMAELSCQRAEKALVDGKDEEALSAFAEALKFTPEDPALIARVEKVRAEKKAKVLAVLLARSEKEAAAKNWEGAIKSLEEALPLAPDDASIQKKLSEVKAAQEKARLDALLAKADTAVKSARWNEAIETLTAALAAKPDEAVEARLTKVRSQQHDARLSELKTQARGLARAERFDEALATWEQYLALEPADHEKAQVETEAVKKAQALANSYTEAQKAYSKKNYDQAVSILKGIINQDENYKDASRLLAQAIELRRTAPRWWQSKSTKESVRFQKPKSRSGIKTGVKRIWIVGILLAILILGVGGPLYWVGRNSLSAIPGFFGTPTPPQELPFTASVEPTSTLTPTLTSRPIPSITLTPRPIPSITSTPDPMQAFESTMQTYMTGHAPTFEDDFSTPDMVWGGTIQGLAIWALVKDGVLPITDHSPDDEAGTTFPSKGLLNASNFALQFDFVFETQKPVDIVAVQFRSYEILFDRTGQWYLNKNDDSQITYITGGFELLKSQENTLLIMAYQENLAVYLNGTLLYATNEIALSGSINTITVTGKHDWGSRMDFDNFKFWDLEGVDFNP